MSIYATPDQIRAELQDLGWRVRLPDDDARLGRLIDRAELDVDRVVGGTYSAASDRKLDPEQLAAPQRAALVRAVAAQVAFRARREHELLDGDDRLRSVGEISWVGTPPRLSPSVVEALAGRGLIRDARTTTATEDAA